MMDDKSQVCVWKMKMSKPLGVQFRKQKKKRRRKKNVLISTRATKWLEPALPWRILFHISICNYLFDNNQWDKIRKIKSFASVFISVNARMSPLYWHFSLHSFLGIYLLMSCFLLHILYIPCKIHNWNIKKWL